MLNAHSSDRPRLLGTEPTPLVTIGMVGSGWRA